MTISKTQTEALLEASAHVPRPWPFFLTRTPERTAAVLEREGLAVMKYDGPGPVIICATTTGRQMAGWLALFFLSAVRNAPKPEPKPAPVPVPKSVQQAIELIEERTCYFVSAKMEGESVRVRMSARFQASAEFFVPAWQCTTSPAKAVAIDIVKRYHKARQRVEFETLNG